MPVELVSSQTDAEIKQAYAADVLAFKLRELAANMLRVVRGAGRSYSLITEMAAVLEAVRSYHDASGEYPSAYLIEQALNVELLEAARRREWRSNLDEETKKRWIEDGTFEREYADRQILRGAMQIVASTLIGQQLQVAAGERELHDGIRARSEAIQKGRTYHLPPVLTPRRQPSRKPKKQ